VNTEEEAMLRSVALQNAREILAARRRAEEELLGTQKTLEMRTQELAHALAAMRVTLDSIADGVLVTDNHGRIVDFNERYRQMWQLAGEDLGAYDHTTLLRLIGPQLPDPQAFLNRIGQIYNSNEAETFDVLTLVSGEVYERYSQIQWVEGCNVGRVWSFRDITQLNQSEQALREEARMLELLRETGAAIMSQRDLGEIVQTVTDAATQLGHADLGVFFFDSTGEDAGTLALHAFSGSAAPVFEKFPLPQAQALFASSASATRIIRSEDVLADPSYGEHLLYFGPPEELLVRSYLAVPVVSRSGVIHGGLLIGYHHTRRFARRDELMLSGLAVPAAIAIDNALLLQQNAASQRQLRELNEVLEQRVDERSAQLRRTELQFQQLVAAVTDYALYMLDPQGNIVSWNPGAERIKGYAGQEIIGHNFSRFYTAEDRSNDLPARALQISKTTGKFEGEGWRVRKDGTRFWANVLIDPIRDGGGNLLGFAKITRDMTQQRAMQEQLHQSQKMEAIGHLTGGVAHDFNNLLTVIIGNLDALRRQIPTDNGRLRRAVDQANRGALRAATLTQQLLAFARRQPLNPKPTDINRLVADMSDLLRHTLGESIAIETVLGGGLWRVDVDAHQLESALLNLAVNSRDAMPDGGKLTIETANTHLDETYTGRFAEIAPGQYVLLCVSDSGEGMRREVMDRAFDPFYTTKPIGRGTGLGLSQVYGFVKQSGGHIKLYSEVGQGTTVKIYLPRLLSLDQSEEPQRPLIVPQGQRNESILVVEDNEDVRTYSTETLRELGFTVLEACDAASALQILEAHREIKLLFTDVGLPGTNGRQLAESAHALRPDLKTLFTSGYARNAIVHQGRLDHGVHLLTKPFTRAQLATRIREVLDAPGSSVLVAVSALVVDDQSHPEGIAADAFQGLELLVSPATTAAGALEAVGAHEFRFAIINVSWPPQATSALVRELRSRQPQLVVILAGGEADSTVTARGALRLERPLQRTALERALRSVGVHLTACT
jgi:PAS domain S-box-containing protein